MPGAIVLKTEKVTRKFGGLTAVDRVDFELPAGSICSIIGPNGAGKTTLFNMIAGLCPPTSGSIWMGETPLASSRGKKMRSLPAHQISRLGVGRTFQNIRLFAGMTVLENVLVGMNGRLEKGLLESLLRLPSEVREERAAVQKALAGLDVVGLRDKGNELSRNLPYGEQRLLEIARAMASDPKILLLDEPGAGMNPAEKDKLKTLIADLRRRTGVTILLIEHDMRFVMGISDRVTVLDYGEKIAEGTPGEVAKNPRVIEAYLGKPNP